MEADAHLQGWRMVFYIMAGVAGLTTVLMLIFGIEPRNVRAKEALAPEHERHRVAKLHVLKQVLGGVVVRCSLMGCYQCRHPLCQSMLRVLCFIIRMSDVHTRWCCAACRPWHETAGGSLWCHPLS